MGFYLVVDDHPLVRDGLVTMLRRLDFGAVVLEAGDSQAALEALLRHPDTDLVLLDLLLPDTSGYAFLMTLRSQYPQVPVVVVSAKEDRDTVSRCVRLGASGFLPKSYTGDQMSAALREVLSGSVHVPRQGTGGVVPQKPAEKLRPARGARLTGAQQRVLELLAQGRSNREIGETLGLAEGTVKIHLTGIYKALNVNNRMQALIALSERARRGQKNLRQ